MRKVLVLAGSLVVLLMLSALQMSCTDTVEYDFIIPTEINLAVATVAADYSAGNFEIMSGGGIRQNLLPGLYTDLVIRARGRYVYILERYGRDKVIKYDSKDRVKEYEQVLGPNLNIQDIAIVSDTKAYISALESSGLIVFDPMTGNKTSTIDLSSFNTYAGTDSAEASPFASALAVYNGYVYVACQRLKTVPSDWGSTFVPADTSLIVVINANSNTVSTSIKLSMKNPASISVSGNRLLVSSSGDWYDPDVPGGVELIDLDNNANLGVVAEKSKFGGSISTVVFVSLDKAYISVMDAGWSTGIVQFNPTSKTVGAKIAGVSDGSGGVAYDGSKLYVGERGGANTGVLVINPNTNEVERTISTGSPPTSIAVISAN